MEDWCFTKHIILINKDDIITISIKTRLRKVTCKLGSVMGNRRSKDQSLRIGYCCRSQ